MRGARSALLWLAAIIAASALAFWLGGYATDVYRKMLIWVALALSYNFLFGIAGQVAFSHFAFAGVGAYGVVILAHKLGLPFGAALVLALALCALLAFIVALPSTRLEGFYLSLATLAFAQLVIVVISEGGDLTGGTGGIANYRLPSVFGYAIRGPWYTVLLVLLVAFTLWTLRRLDYSAFGRACRAIRDNAIAAAAMGVDVRRIKVQAFTLTSTLAGLAGVAYAYIDNVINPPVFGIENVFLLLFMVIVGGSGSHIGAIIGAVFLYLAPFVLEPIVGHGFLIVFGVLVVLTILFQPSGLAGLLNRRPAQRCDMSGKALIAISGLTKHFGGLTAVEDSGFELFPGEILALIGPNGAGKTTTFNLIAGVSRPTAGSIALAGARIDGLPVHRIAALGLMRTFQHNMPFAGMSLTDNILVGCHTNCDGSLFDILLGRRRFA